MNEHDDSLLKDTFRRAAPDLPEEARGRALQAMSQSHLKASRFRFIPNAVGAALVMAALASMPFRPAEQTGGVQVAMAAEQMLAESERAARPVTPQARKESQREELPESLRQYAAEAPAFVRKHYPNDPRMLIAAGLLTRDVGEARSLLKAAIDKGGGGAAWAAYAALLMETGPGYARPANWVADPTDPKSMAEVKKELAKTGLPDSLSEAQAAPVLEALKRWQAVESDNAYPVALAVHYLYGLHHDREALARWEQASRMSKAETHSQDSINATVQLLRALGAIGWEAISGAYNGIGLPFNSQMRGSARIAGYEGKLAVVEHRPEDAVKWWMATTRLGRLMQKSERTLIESLVGIAVEGIGGAPTWVWQPDSVTGIPGGPLYRGRLYWGQQHALFLRVAGKAADEDVRDSLVRAKVHSMLTREYARRLGAFPGPILRAMLARAAILLTGVVLVASLVIFVAVSLVARRKADEATTLSRRGMISLWAAGFLPLLAGLALMWLSSVASSVGPAFAALLFVCFGTALLLWLAGPLIAGFWTRRPGSKLATVWRGNLRRVLPLALATCAVLSLGLRLVSLREESSSVRQWLGESEMDRVVREIGAEWRNPKIPSDAWRAEYPPKFSR
jgi:hypothetical protein